MRLLRNFIALLVFALLMFASPAIHAQGIGNSAAISGTVLDPAGAVVPESDCRDS